MSRGVFRGNNSVTYKTWDFKTDNEVGGFGTVTFDPSLTVSNDDRVTWVIENNLIAGNSISYSFPDSTVKTVTVKTNSLDNITGVDINGSTSNCDVYGELDMSNFNNLTDFRAYGNPNLSAITNTVSYQTLTDYRLNDCNITGNLDLTMFPNLGGVIYLYNNSNLTGVTHTGTTQLIIDYQIRNCNITGNHDVSMISNFSGNFYMFDNPNLTSITHSVPTIISGDPSLFRYYAWNCDLTGNHDMSMFPNLGGYFNLASQIFDANPNLTGVTHTQTQEVFNQYAVAYANIIGHHDMTWCPNLGGSFTMSENNSLTSVTHTASTQTFTYYDLFDCDITGNHDLSMFPNLGGNFYMGRNSNLTGVTHTPTQEVFTNYSVPVCNLTGNYDMTWCPNLGGSFSVSQNPNLTGVTHTASTQTFTNFQFDRCDITGEYDVSMLNIEGYFIGYNNTSLTAVTHNTTPSYGNFFNYWLENCDITGTHDVSMFPNLNVNFTMRLNPNLTSVIHTASTIGNQYFSTYELDGCNITGTHDVSMLSIGGNGSNGWFDMSNNSNLTNVLFPYTTNKFQNYDPAQAPRAIDISGCDIGYVNFLPLSGATLLVNGTYGASIHLQNNNMSVTNVNHILVDFDNLSSNLNPAGWTGVTLNIGGSNAAPDSSSGGFDGIAAINSLTGGTNQWTITTS